MSALAELHPPSRTTRTTRRLMNETAILLKALEDWIASESLLHASAAARLAEYAPDGRALTANTVTRWINRERGIARWWRPVIRKVCAAYLPAEYRDRVGAADEPEAAGMTDTRLDYDESAPVRPLRPIREPEAGNRIANSPALRAALKATIGAIGMTMDEACEVPGYDQKKVYRQLLDGVRDWWYPERLAFLVRHLGMSMEYLPLTDDEADLLEAALIDTARAPLQHRLLPVLGLDDLATGSLDDIYHREAMFGEAVSVPTDGRRYVSVRVSDDSLAPICPAGGAMLCRQMELEPNNVYVLRDAGRVHIVSLLGCVSPTACLFRAIGSNAAPLVLNPAKLDWIVRAVQFCTASELIHIAPPQAPDTTN